jgi:hypothetical protein
MADVTTDSSVLSDRSLNFVDMHHHSRVSDGAYPPEILAKIALKNGRGLCITDHNQISGSLFLARQKEVFTVPSIEVTSRDAKDILAYFYRPNDLVAFWECVVRRNIRNNAIFNLNRTAIGTIELIEKISGFGGIPVLAHPFELLAKNSSHLFSDKDVMGKVAGIELLTFISRGIGGREIIEKLGKPMTAGSDSHTASFFNAMTASHSFDVDGFLEDILQKKSLIYHSKDWNAAGRILCRLVAIKNNLNLSFGRGAVTCAQTRM